MAMKKSLLKLMAIAVALALPTGVFAQSKETKSTATQTTSTETKATTETKSDGKKTTKKKSSKKKSTKKSTESTAKPEPTKAPAK
jgi:uncharacterized protein HemX